VQYRRLGSAGAKVSVISLGGWINFEQKLPEAEARNIVARAIEHGVNFFDVADGYGRGTAEQWMGKLLHGRPRHTLVISTKVYAQMSDDVNDQGLSRKHIMESIDKSLLRLGTDYLDIYFCHRTDPNTPILETARAMDDLVRQGKVLYWGTSKWEPDLLEEVYGLAGRYGLYPPQVEQPQYSMLVRESFEGRIIPVATKLGMGLTVFSPLARGLLTGKYDDGIPADSRFAKEPWGKEAFLTDQNAARVLKLKPIADELGLTRGQLALGWLLRQPAVSSVITGATKAAQMVENVAAADVALSAETLARIDAALA
jgi:voltage-dependent potassium channel beta subunit